MGSVITGEVTQTDKCQKDHTVILIMQICSVAGGKVRINFSLQLSNLTHDRTYIQGTPQGAPIASVMSIFSFNTDTVDLATVFCSFPNTQRCATIFKITNIVNPAVPVFRL